MGLDASFEWHGADGSEEMTLWRKELVGVLWLACFRVSDVVFPEYDARFPDYISAFRCEVGVARRQFEEGLELLRVTFPETDFELGEVPNPPETGMGKARGVTAFRELLAGMEDGHVVMPLCYLCDFTGGYISRFFMHAVGGFSDPGRKIFFDESDVRRGLGLTLNPGVTAPGVMTWGDFLRALTLHQAGIVLRTAGEDGQVQGPRCLFTAEEYDRERWVLTGLWERVMMTDRRAEVAEGGGDGG